MAVSPDNAAISSALSVKDASSKSATMNGSDWPGLVAISTPCCHTHRSATYTTAF